MVYAFNPKNWQMSDHNSNYGDFSIMLDSITGSCTMTGGLKKA
jgi:hypothetical protein